MSVLSFESFDDMQRFLAQASEQARQNLHPEQRTITYGSTWVQFADVARRHVVFGKVCTLAEVKELEIAAGANLVAANEAVDQTQIDAARGLMYGHAADVFNPRGEYGMTHLANMWPIDLDVYRLAYSHRWRIDALPLSARVTLEQAFISRRNWMRRAI